MNDTIYLILGDRSKLKAVRLQCYWKKLCEDEERSRRRNEQLLREFDRVEAHMAVLAERTQRQQRIKARHIYTCNSLCNIYLVACESLCLFETWVVGQCPCLKNKPNDCCKYIHIGFQRVRKVC